MKSNIHSINFKEVIVSGLNTSTDMDIKVAIYDILEENSFSLIDLDENLFTISLWLQENIVTFIVSSQQSKINLKTVSINFKSVSKILKEYIILCDSYYDSIKSAPIQKVEALDMGRRSLHDDASHDLLSKLKGNIDMSFDTARRFITLFGIIQRKSLLGKNILL
tara:strand:+ start:179 stop:673 length:495 start_codon:yes stop_codon:yes gene_type:complete